MSIANDFADSVIDIAKKAPLLAMGGLLLAEGATAQTRSLGIKPDQTKNYARPPSNDAIREAARIKAESQTYHVQAPSYATKPAPRVVDDLEPMPGRFYRVGGGVDYSSSPYLSGPKFGFSGEYAFGEKGNVKIAGGYDYYTKDPNKISFGGNYNSYFYSGSYKYTHIPSHADLKVGLQTNPKNQVKLETNVGVEGYLGSQVIWSRTASPFAETKASLTLLGRDNVLNLEVEGHARYTKFNNYFYNNFIYRKNAPEDRSGAASYGASINLLYNPQW